MPHKHLWWQKGVIYQIYPRSFMDASGDGVGDLAGITARLDYLQWLGVDAVWISPIFPSPMADFGYDVADYTGIDPLFGTLDDFDRLVEAAHARGLKVILDYVPNHTSDRHPWFLESRSSRDNAKRDWYIWRDPAPDGGPPNNWLAHFGGVGWEFDEATGQYYFHSFLPEQPDLNWRNPEVQEAMLDVLRFWFDRGVDGFRIDVLWHIVKDDQFRDNPPNPDWVPAQGPYNKLVPVYTTDRPEVHDLIARMRALADAYDERVLIGEIYLPVERLVTYYGEDGAGVHLPFNFQLVTLPWNASAIKHAVDNYEAALPPDGWPNWVLGNHDNHRIASRIGEAQARVAAMLLLTLRGTPTLYYGDEIGMHDVPIPPDRVQDPYEKNVPGLGLGRDPERTPMQWEPGPAAGFTQNARPWLPLADDVDERNVVRMRDDAGSILTLHRRLLQLRASERALAVGGYAPLELAGDVIAYVRKDEQSRFLVALNLSHDAEYFPLHALSGHVVLSTCLDREGEPVEGVLQLRKNEGVVVRLTSGA